MLQNTFFYWISKYFSTYPTKSYLRDVNGNTLAIYQKIPTQQEANLLEQHIYGSARLGQYRPKAATKPTALGQRIYEFSNHLGNVLVTLSDNKVPQTDGTYASVVVSASDYYPFGLAMGGRTYQNSEYRYGFNGKEDDEDFGSHIQDYGFRLYSKSTVRFYSPDPLIVQRQQYPELTSYNFASNSPIWMIDLWGLQGDPNTTVGEEDKPVLEISMDRFALNFKLPGKQDISIEIEAESLVYAIFGAEPEKVVPDVKVEGKMTVGAHIGANAEVNGIALGAEVNAFSVQVASASVQANIDETKIETYNVATSNGNAKVEQKIAASVIVGGGIERSYDSSNPEATEKTKTVVQIPFASKEIEDHESTNTRVTRTAAEYAIGGAFIVGAELKVSLGGSVTETIPVPPSLPSLKTKNLNKPKEESFLEGFINSVQGFLSELERLGSGE